jgi:hypothetical protein
MNPAMFGSVGAGTAAAAAANLQAIKASGAIVAVEPGEFVQILERTEEPLVVCATGGFFTTNYQYLTNYKGLIFFTKASEPLVLPADSEVVVARKIWVPPN